ncbi:MAG TPA: hypothetical protein VNZ64_05670 [Candidatus Acidoferrum sp.]|jgi:hypothetical protein|nr:hypothetical protein [Candidatus Acidoferrum sp.]
MTLSAITPYVTMLGPLWVATGTLDLVLKDPVKHRVADRLRHLSNVGSKPCTLAFYGLLVLASCCFTIMIISVNGGLHTIQEHHGSMRLALDSAGPLLLAVALKILTWDYLMALKSSTICEGLRRARRFNSAVGAWKTLLARPGMLAIIALDFYCTAVATAAFLNWSDLARVSSRGAQANGAQTVYQALTSLFRAIDFLLNESMRQSFYILNGSLFFYMALAFSKLAHGAVPTIDVEQATRNIFKVIAAFISVILTIVLICYWIVSP